MSFLTVGGEGRGVCGDAAAEHCSGFSEDMCLRGRFLPVPLFAFQRTHCGVFFAVLFFSLGLPGRRHKQSECRTELHTNIQIHKHSKLSTTDLLVLASMKNAANCDT